jgi:hypothetical protein
MVRKLGKFIKAQTVLDNKKKGVAGVIADVRQDDMRPGKLIIDFDTELTVAGGQSWRVPQKEAEALADQISPNEKDWIGCGLKLAVRDYLENGFAPGFVISEVVSRSGMAKRKRKSSPTTSPVVRSADEGPVPVFSDDECPF